MQDACLYDIIVMLCCEAVISQLSAGLHAGADKNQLFKIKDPLKTPNNREE